MLIDCYKTCDSVTADLENADISPALLALQATSSAAEKGDWCRVKCASCAALSYLMSALAYNLIVGV